MLALAGCGGSSSPRRSRTDAAAGAAARADGARPGEGDRPAVAERLARALRGPDALLGDRRRAGPGRVVGRRRGRARLDVPPAQGDPLERRHADHGRGLHAARGCARSRPSTNAPYAGPELGIVRGARHLHATGNGSIGVQVLDDRTLRVTLQHPVPWLDELAAFPVAAPVPPRPKLYSGPFRIVSRAGGKLVLERNFNYWNAGEVKPSRLVLSTATKGADAVLPRQLAGPGLPWIDTAGRPARRRRRAAAARDRPALARHARDAAVRPRLAPVRRLGDHAPRPRHGSGLVRAARDARRERRQLACAVRAAERTRSRCDSRSPGPSRTSAARGSRPSCAARHARAAPGSSSSAHLPPGAARWPSSRPSRAPT